MEDWPRFYLVEASSELLAQAVRDYSMPLDASHLAFKEGDIIMVRFHSAILCAFLWCFGWAPGNNSRSWTVVDFLQTSGYWTLLQPQSFQSSLGRDWMAKIKYSPPLGRRHWTVGSYAPHHEQIKRWSRDSVIVFLSTSVMPASHDTSLKFQTTEAEIIQKILQCRYNNAFCPSVDEKSVCNSLVSNRSVWYFQSQLYK